MEPQTDTRDAFDAAVVAESTYVDPPPVVETDTEVTDAPPAEEKPAVPRDASGKFTKVEQAEADAESETPVVAKPAEKKPRNDPQARIDQAIARQRDAERRAEDAQRRAEDAERRAAERAARTEHERRAPDTALAKSDEFPDFATWMGANPQPEGVDPLTAYMRAHYRFERDNEIKAEKEQRETEQAEQRFTTRATRFSDQYAQATEADPDLPSRIDRSLLTVKPYSDLTPADKQVIRSLPERDREAIAFRCFLADQWLESEHPVALLEYLSDPREFQRLATLPPNQVIRALARFEAGLSAASRKDTSGSVRETKPASQARAPIKPLGTTSHVPADDDGSDDEPVEAFIRRENSKDRKAGRL